MSEFFTKRTDKSPKIYGFIHPNVSDKNGYIKIGYTEDSIDERVKQINHTAAMKYEIVFRGVAMREDGTSFTDHDIHALLRKRGIPQLNYGTDRNEWFKCSLKQLEGAFNSLLTRTRFDPERTQSFKMRPEQAAAVKRTSDYFHDFEHKEAGRLPKFLWNAKMRFGKTFASYQLAKQEGYKRILILTFKPAVEDAWAEDLMTHVDFAGWEFVSDRDAQFTNTQMDAEFAAATKRAGKNPVVVFASFQNVLGKNDSGGMKVKNEFIHTVNWDLVIFDEYHFGAWRENAKKLFEIEDEEETVDFDREKYQAEEAGNAINESFLPITSTHYLYLSGTPFRALNSGEFIEEQIFNWTYSDEQREKENWRGTVENPYLEMPRMVLLTYQIPEEIRQIAVQGEFDEFDLNEFFAAEMQAGKADTAKFKHEEYVQKWLSLIRGAYLPSSKDDLKLGHDKRPPMPYSDERLLNILTHTLWFMPNVASCYAMANLLRSRANVFYHDYKVIVCAGTQAGIGLKALGPVRDAMQEPLEKKTITLSCGKLTTGVTIRPWSGIFMLRNLKSPETYFQAAFRVQSPWWFKDESGNKKLLKEDCYIFDFAIDRALRQVSDYSCQLDPNGGNPEKKVGEFIKFLPVLAYDGSNMREVNAQEILDLALSGTSATLLAKRWESALLVNVDNDTLLRIMANPDILAALMKIEGFRSLNADITVIINKSDVVKRGKKEDKKKSDKEKKELTEAEKEMKSKRKEIQEKLIKFATRVPIFMYLTDYRETCLKDVITQLEPGLFKKVTGLDVEDFNKLCEIGVFNASLMNEAIFKFKRYEDSSLSYTGIDKHQEAEVGGWDTSIRKEDYEKLFYNQQKSMLQDEGKTPKHIVVVPKTVSNYNRVIKTTGTKVAEPAKIEREKLQVVDLSEVKMLTKVSHKLFGVGKIVGINRADEMIVVKFDAGGSKSFEYPDAFEDGYLVIVK